MLPVSELLCQQLQPLQPTLLCRASWLATTVL